MAVMRIVVVVVACLTLLVQVTEGNNPSCYKFSQLKLEDGQSKNYSCPEEECSERSERSGKVVGTGEYFGGSDICLAALHAGVVTRLGTNVTITLLNDTTREVFGTSQNRIVSQTKKRKDAPVFRVQNLVQEETDMVDEVLMVHNGGSGSVVRFTCFSQDQKSTISATSVQNWNYTKIEINNSSGDGSPKLVFDFNKKSNVYAVRLLGTRRDKDVLAVVQYPEAQYQSRVATLRVSLGDNISLGLMKRKPTEQSPVDVLFQRLPDTNWVPGSLPLSINSANSSSAGIYTFRDTSINIENTHWANMDWMIRGCHKDRYGPKCQEKCPQCLNGGQCHSHLGTCVCAPGFIGKTCQYACPAGWFGNKCQFSCSQDLRGTQVGEEEERERSCRGLTICQPYPYGCSCAAGFSHDQPGRTCSKECRAGHYGADCEQKCQNCLNDKCHPDSGTCVQGCQRGKDCRKDMPSPDVNLTSLRRGFSASWKASTDKDTYYFISHELLHRHDCRVNDTERRHQHLLTTLEYNTTALLQYAAYNVCVVASSPKADSRPSCSEVVTLSEVPSVNITSLECVDAGKTLTCFVNVSGGCENYNGPNATVTFTLHAKLACSDPLTTLKNFTKLSDTTANASFSDYLHGETYQVTAEVGNNIGPGDRRNINFSTNAREPPPIVNVTHISLSDSAIQLKWNDPCPSNGKIKMWRFARNGTNETKWQELQSCGTSASNRCHNITGLELGNVYNYKIEQKNDGGTDYGYNYTVKVEEKEPGPPNVTTAGKGDQQLNLTLELPSYHGGTLRNCCITFTPSKEECNDILNLDSQTLNFMFDGLEQGKKYEAEAYCCNNKFCGERWRQPVATKPLPIPPPAAPSILKKTNSTVTLRLPVITHDQDGNRSLVVFVQQEPQNQNFNLTEEIIRLFETQQRQTRKKRHSSLGEDQCKAQVWIAAELNEAGKEFVLGDGQKYGDFLNCPLKLGQTYIIGLMVVNELLGEKTYSFVILDGGVVVEPTDISSYDPLLLLLLLLLIFPLFGLLAYLCYSRQPASKEDEQKITANHALQDMTPVMGPLVTTNRETIKEDKIEDEPIYENLNPQASLATTSQVPYEEVEGYLNKMIGSKEIGDDFRTVPGTLNKSMVVALFPEHRGKNRYKNNLPFDDTRVVLSKLDDDPSSDYINANHVPGYGNMRYIATQGPKNAKVCTIADFWRMVMEQQINVIIMVANFVENGKRKVGEYYTPGQTLNFSGFEVVVDNQEHLPHFTVSSISVKWKEEVHQVQHYHYQKWPDHGIPFEAYSIAQMLIHFQSYHSGGGTVVHCSAGIGRTGTVLQVLMMCEMLNLKSYLSPLEVLGRLRMSRARLVENEAQYNLSLEILEEVLFGRKTNVSTDYLSNHLDKCILSSRTQYAKAKALPSPLTYTTSNLPICQSLNRNPSILPSDSSRFYLQPKAGLNAELSQYINAIRVPFLDKQKFITATEHPLPDTVANFWRLVVETECTLIIFINSLEDQKEGEFPTMLHAPEMWQVGDYQLQVEQTEQYGVWLRHSVLTITSKKDGGMHRVHVYQSIQWPISSSLPPSPLLLLTVAELLQVPRSAKAGPPLLCCGDGVTGCGLVAGMAMIIKHLQEEQVVDVYRMVVKLQRARQQFIVSKEQFSMLYTGAAMYLREFSNYGNFQ
ncbi:receptor-type tyrosine-protein phosphatase T-like isoform X2 [Eriocheir sinensis]|uniref:receptor-type tyrosine-protein phosphatase T-like isoform X1 n=2 Tax=Eriocheir sinensis TaxID=95602 RepID=UPI0021C7645E|nr:receptor-type tyrosine-protein phosphatase T-like isoform X1 [Eriocheir sinensis]XP_050687646.1 receptor-type tyrosine-protein phosphatase T-like isoform X2 [Eriocheir sinensis]